LRTLVSRKISR